MFYFIKPKTVLKFSKDHKITEFNKVVFSKESNDHFEKTMKKLRDMNREKK